MKRRSREDSIATSYSGVSYFRSWPSHPDNSYSCDYTQSLKANELLY